MKVPVNREFLASAASIGASLNVEATARRLADIAVAGLGGVAAVDLALEIEQGGEPPRRTAAEPAFRRAALAPGERHWPAGYPLAGQQVPVVGGHYRSGEASTVSGRTPISAFYGHDPDVIRAHVPMDGDGGELSMVFAPLVTGSAPEPPNPPGTISAEPVTTGPQALILGSIEVWRPKPFSDEEVQSLRWLCAHAAVSIDNARRYAREHLVALSLQKGLLPKERVVMTAGETAGVYLPAGGGDDLGGDWFDVIPLSSARMGLVVGDVVGYGVRAAATMGRMCTAVRTLCDIDLAPDELITHLDDLVVRLAEGDDPAHRDASGSTCVYAIVDPITRRCSVASAGHPPPVLVRRDGTAQFVDLVPGPVLGVGGLAFEVTEFSMEDGDMLALYSDGLIKHQRDDLGLGMETLRERLSSIRPGSGDLGAAASRLVEGIDDQFQVDDVTLLLARVRCVPENDTASWVIPADPARVAENRKKAIAQIEEWGLTDLAFATELVVSELVTNAIRYGDGDITLRLIRQSDRLVCEVSDPSHTAPHLRRARDTDEGGRGLFIVARLVTRWGVRYAPVGKTIWTEQRLQSRAGRSDFT